MTLNVLPNVQAPPIYSPAELRVLYSDEVDAVARLKASGKPRGPKTGLRSLDRVLGGFLPPGLYVIHGEPGSGKSALAWQIAADAGCASLYVTTEMSALELTRRHVARNAGKPRRSLLSCIYSPLEEKAMADFATREDCPHIIDGCSLPVTSDDIGRWLQLVPRMTQSDHMVCVIDSLHSWVTPLASSEGMTEYESINAGLLALRALSSTYNTVFIVLSERNRIAAKTGGMNAGRGSGRIEYSADVLMELSSQQKGESSGLTRIDLKLTKNRLGPSGAIVPLAFQGDTMNFTDAELRFGS